MTKPSRQERMNAPDNPAKSITERVKKLRGQEQTEKVKEEIDKLIKEYKRRFLRRAGN